MFNNLRDFQYRLEYYQVENDRQFDNFKLYLIFYHLNIGKTFYSIIKTGL